MKGWSIQGCGTRSIGVETSGGFCYEDDLEDQTLNAGDGLLSFS